MIKLLKMGNLDVVKIYTDLDVAIMDVINKNAEEYLIEYLGNLYNINVFLKEVNKK